MRIWIVVQLTYKSIQGLFSYQYRIHSQQYIRLRYDLCQTFAYDIWFSIFKKFSSSIYSVIFHVGFKIPFLWIQSMISQFFRFQIQNFFLHIQFFSSWIQDFFLWIGSKEILNFFITKFNFFLYIQLFSMLDSRFHFYIWIISKEIMNCEFLIISFPDLLSLF